MRIDKFLRISRLIKRRTVVRGACERGRVGINDKVVKLGDDVKVGDIIEIPLGQEEFKCRTVDLKDHVGKSETQPSYESF